MKILWLQFQRRWRYYLAIIQIHGRCRQCWRCFDRTWRADTFSYVSSTQMLPNTLNIGSSSAAWVPKPLCWSWFLFLYPSIVLKSHMSYIHSCLTTTFISSYIFVIRYSSSMCIKYRLFGHITYKDSWRIFQLDMSPVFETTCKQDDFEIITIPAVCTIDVDFHSIQQSLSWSIPSLSWL